MKLPLPVLLALLSAIPPLAIDMYLPAMALMADDLSVDIHKVELSVSTFLMGYALGQLAGGPLSDRFGRRPIILLGITLFTLSSLMLIAIDSLSQLLLLRFIQALGGGMATVNSAAVIRDRFQGSDVAKTLSMVAMIMMLAPLLAPLLGSVIIKLADWRQVFTFLSVYSLATLAILSWQLSESHPPHKRQKSAPWQNYWRVICHHKARRYALALAFAFTSMFVFITASPYLYLQHFNQTPDSFPWLFGANILVMMSMNRLNIRLLNRFSSQTLLLLGCALQTLAALTLLLLYLLTQPSLIVTVPFIALAVGSLGLIAANAMSLVLNYFQDISGSATALIGVSEFCCGALLGYIWSVLHNDTPVPMMALMFLSALLALVCVIIARYQPAQSTE